MSSRREERILISLSIHPMSPIQSIPVYKQWIGIAVGLFPPLSLKGLSFHLTLSHIKKCICEPPPFSLAR